MDAWERQQIYYEAQLIETGSIPLGKLQVDVFRIGSAVV